MLKLFKGNIMTYLMFMLVLYVFYATIHGTSKSGIMHGF